jgi:hypothetical protein
MPFGDDKDKGARYKNPARPTHFGLYKLGPLEPLKWLERKVRSISPAGTPLLYAVDESEDQVAHRIEFRLNSNRIPVTNENQDEVWGKPYDWFFEIRIPGGGFVLRASDYDLIAPESGYKDRIVFGYSASLPAEQWQPNRREWYFVKFADGTYGRFEIDLDAGDESVMLYGCTNPKVGSRNLAAPDPVPPGR